MANVERRLPENVPGDFFIDSSCINCDTCSELAPETFRDHGDQSSVYRQPKTPEQTRLALMSLVACPTGSIGTVESHDVHIGIDAFPSLIADNVYFCGFTSESSFGAWSYLIVRPEEEGGNVLVDSPRFASQLVKKIEPMGGLKQIFLTHKDDVADHQLFAARFHAQRIMHLDDGAGKLGIERVIKGEKEVRLDEDLVAIPTPGHTRGHMVLLYKNRFLFTGDHLAWSPGRKSLTAFRNATWYSWTEQIRSMKRLLAYDFEWVLPGHGYNHNDSVENMRHQLEQLVIWMDAHR